MAYSTLDDLYTALSEAAQTGSGTLVLTPVLTDGLAPLSDFVTSLPQQQLNLGAARFAPDPLGTATTFSVTGVPSGIWLIPGINAEGLTLQTATLVFSQPTDNVPITTALTLEGTLPVASPPISLTGTLQEDASLRFELTSPGEGSVPLAAIANYASNGGLDRSVPTEVAILETLPLTNLLLDFGYTLNHRTTFHFGAQTGESWVLAEGLSLDNFGATIVAEYAWPAPGMADAFYNGFVEASLTIGGQAFDVILYFLPGHVWEITVAPINGDVLPGLEALAELVGVAPETLDTALATLGLGSLSVTQVRLQFNYTTGAILNVYLGAAIGMDWADVGVTFSVDVFGSLPGLQLGGSLREGNVVPLDKLVTHYFGVAGGFPSAELTRFSLLADLDAPAYQMGLGIASEQFRVGPVTLNQVGLDLSYTGIDASGALLAVLRLGDPASEEGTIDVFVTAKSEHIAEGGWVFAGSTAEGQILSIGSMLTYLVHTFGFEKTLPSYFDEITLQDIAVELNTGTEDFTFDLTGHFPLPGAAAPATLNVSFDLAYGTPYTLTLGGQLLIGDQVFTLDFTTGDADTILHAQWHDTGDPVTLEDLAEAMGLDALGFPTIPAALNLGLTDLGVVYDVEEAEFVLTATLVHPDYGQAKCVFIVLETAQDVTAFTFNADIDIDINLSNLPLIGQELGRFQTVAIQGVTVLIASADLDATQVTQLNDDVIGTYAPGYPLLPANGVVAGLSLQLPFDFGGDVVAPQVPVVSRVEPGGDGAPTLAPPLPDPTTWFDLQKSFGPVTFKRVGVLYQEEALTFKLDAAMAFGGLGFSVEGLSVSSPLDTFAPHFHIDGLGLSLIEGPLEIAGAFLNKPVAAEDCGAPAPGDCFEYAGGVTIMFGEYGFAAVGSYANLGTYPSLFVFAEIDLPLVSLLLYGYPVLTLNGLSGGFGYNSHLRIPGLDEVFQFPFVAGLADPTVLGEDPTPLAVLDVLETGTGGKPPWLTHQAGEDWLAFGVSFNSFELIDTRALLIANFGKAFELALLGLATMSLPKGSPEVFAYVELELEAVFLPADGFIGVSAVLSPNAYVLDKDCHLTGGFAFYLWVAGENAGDFALTVGGYHPAFDRPAHYPVVPRVGFNWPIDKHITIKGEAYMALTPAMLMAGGLLDATYADGDLKAWFHAQADFLIGWEPFHYEASIGVSVGASYKLNLLFTHKTVSTEVGATLDLWGPRTGGQVKVHWSIISFTVDFGAPQNATPAVLTWAEMAQQLLPYDTDTDQVYALAANATAGLVTIDKTDPDVPVWIVRPSGFGVAVRSAVPASTLSVTNTGADTTALPASTEGIDIRPMAANEVASVMTLSITQNANVVPLTGWTLAPAPSHLPTAVWGAPLSTHKTRSPNEAPTVPATVGFVVTGPAATLATSMAEITLDDLGEEPIGATAPLPLAPTAAPPTTAAPTEDPSRIATVMQTVNDATVVGNRQALYDALGGLYGGFAGVSFLPDLATMDLPALAAEAGQIYVDPPLAPPVAT